ncbi:MAG: hypothetical protein ACK421_01190 [Pseudanabaenaceae cyanobacterium]
MYKFVAEIQRELDRLGAQAGTPLDQRQIMDCYWYAGGQRDWQYTDPQGELTEIADFYKHFFGLYWGELVYIDPYNNQAREVSMLRANANYDVVLEGKRRLLYAFAYDETYQNIYSFDLLTQGDDPAVYIVDYVDIEDAHIYFRKLSTFLSTLQRAGSL